MSSIVYCLYIISLAISSVYLLVSGLPICRSLVLHSSRCKNIFGPFLITVRWNLCEQSGGVLNCLLGFLLFTLSPSSISLHVCLSSVPRFTHHSLTSNSMPYPDLTWLPIAVNEINNVNDKNSVIHPGHFYSDSSSPLLLRGATNTPRILCRSFTSKRHRQLRMKDLPKVPTWRIELDSNPRLFGPKVPILPMSHRPTTPHMNLPMSHYAPHEQLIENNIIIKGDQHGFTRGHSYFTNMLANFEEDYEKINEWDL